MTTYLDKEAVLNALDEEAQVGEKCTILRLRSRLERGEFDVKPLLTDEEIAKLREYKETTEHSLILVELARQCTKQEIARKDAEIAGLKASNGNLKKLTAIRPEYVLGLEDKIVELEKLTALQKETIDAQGKDLQEVRNNTLAEVSDHLYAEFHAYQSPLPFTATDLVKIQGDIIRSLRQTAQKEPELFICPKVDCKRSFCYHRAPHKYMDECSSSASPEECPNCVPFKPAPQPSPVPKPSKYVCGDDCRGECSGEADGTSYCPKSPVPTSGTGTAPEGTTCINILTSRLSVLETDVKYLQDINRWVKIDLIHPFKPIYIRKDLYKSTT